MIQGIILDVDGVILGGKPGYNWPDPHPDVIDALKKLHTQGISISLCTGRGTFTLRDIVESVHLDNPHIGDGGAIVVDIIHNQLIDKHTIPADISHHILKTYQQHGIYIEVYSIDGYYIQKKSVCEITQKHAAILHTEATVVDSLDEVIDHMEVVKIMPIATDGFIKQKVMELFSEYNDTLSLQWGTHPSADSYQFGIITAKGISKQYAAGVVSTYITIPFSNILGIGDSATDWEFMKLCGFAGAMGNADSELKQQVLQRNDATGYIGKDIDENGILDIFSHFGLTV